MLINLTGTDPKRVPISNNAKTVFPGATWECYKPTEQEWIALGKNRDDHVFHVNMLTQYAYNLSFIFYIRFPLQ